MSGKITFQFIAFLTNGLVFILLFFNFLGYECLIPIYPKQNSTFFSEFGELYYKSILGRITQKHTKARPLGENAANGKVCYNKESSNFFAI